MTDVARKLSSINEDMIALRKKLRRQGVAEWDLNEIWRLKEEAFRRGVEWAEIQKAALDKNGVEE